MARVLSDLGKPLSETWHDGLVYTPVAKPPKNRTVAERRVLQQKWQDCDYPNSILITQKFKANIGSFAILADYLFFGGNRAFIS